MNELCSEWFENTFWLSAWLSLLFIVSYRCWRMHNWHPQLFIRTYVLQPPGRLQMSLLWLPSQLQESVRHVSLLFLSASSDSSNVVQWLCSQVNRIILEYPFKTWHTAALSIDLWDISIGFPLLSLCLCSSNEKYIHAVAVQCALVSCEPVAAIEAGW